jgi:peptidoglycan hydrolase-like protein with peptidoglycan-binding domain
MYYRPYYGARRLTYGSLWRRPGTSPASGYTQAGTYPYRSGNQGYQTSGYRGRWPGYSSYYSRYRQGWPSSYRGRLWASGPKPYYGAGSSYGTFGQMQGSQTMPPQWVLWAQSCLAQTVGSWVPQTGRLGQGTRKAIRIFQSQRQLPATGQLDATTVNALKAACSRQAAASVGAPAPPPPPPPPTPPAGDDVAAATAAATSAGPDAGDAPPDAAAPPADATTGEFGRWRQRRMGRLWGGSSRYSSDGDDGSGGYGLGYGRRKGWQQ